MSALASNVTWLVVFPAAVVAGFLSAICRLLDASLTDHAVGGTWTALVALGLGIYFVGHPRYPSLVPLIRASTPWLFAAGGVYLTLGATSFAYARSPRVPAGGTWLAATLAIGIGVLAANGFEFTTVVRLLGSNDVGPSLYVSIPLALLFPFGYNRYFDGRERPVLPLLLVFTLYGLVLANSVPLTERVRGPVAVVFVAFGCIGVLLGTPSYVLGTTLRSSPSEP